jgi:RES domain-containing protein/HEPN superfamily RES-like protein
MTSRASWEGEWPFRGDAFEEFVLDAFRESTWTGDDPAVLTESESRHYSWQLFSETVKHDARFLFILLQEPDEEDEPGYPLQLGGAMLRELGDLISRFGLVIDLPEGETLHRVRPHKSDEDPTTARSLGTPPAEKASQSRMSPAGIPMFYSATDLPTAYAETVTEKTQAAKTVTFTTSRAARIVDLDRLPDVPSLFDLSEGAIRDRPSLGFLAGFRRDVSRPIERDDRIHIEYVPTQVVGEYLRHLFRDTYGKPVDGIAWESAQREGGRNVVLFVRNEQCIEADAPAPSGWDGGKLALRLASHRPLDLTAGSAGRVRRRGCAPSPYWDQ